MASKEQILRSIAAGARYKAARLAGELARAQSKDRESILAGMEFERWLADSCEEIVDNLFPRPS